MPAGRAIGLPRLASSRCRTHAVDTPRRRRYSELSAVDQRAGMGASRVRRLLSRALLVVGGAVAGTAAAWALSTATAAAEAPQADIVSTIVSVEQQLPVVEPAKQIVDNIDEKLRAEQEKARVALPVVAEVTRPGSAPSRHGRPHRCADWHQCEGCPAARGGSTGSGRRARRGSPHRHRSPAPSGDQGRTRRCGRGMRPPPTTVLPSPPTRPRELPVPVSVPVHCGCGIRRFRFGGRQQLAAQAASANAHDSAVARALKPSTERGFRDCRASSPVSPPTDLSARSAVAIHAAPVIDRRAFSPALLIRSRRRAPRPLIWVTRLPRRLASDHPPHPPQGTSRRRSNADLGKARNPVRVCHWWFADARYGHRFCPGERQP